MIQKMWKEKAESESKMEAKMRQKKTDDSEPKMKLQMEGILWPSSLP